MSKVTWNMQGAMNGNDSKWVTGVKLLVQNYGVVCLQECGNLPATVVQQQLPAGGILQQPPVGGMQPPALLANGYRYMYVTLNMGTRSRPFMVYIFWIETDPNGHRVNIAICSTTAPLALLCAGPGMANSRPAIGMQFVNPNNPQLVQNIYSLHCFAGGGGDAVHLLGYINQGPAPWYALGDYNRHPNTLNILPLPYDICPPPPNQPTHQDGGTLDYMVTSAGAGNQQIGQVQDNSIWSDHFFVSYN